MPCRIYKLDFQDPWFKIPVQVQIFALENLIKDGVR